MPRMLILDAPAVRWTGGLTWPVAVGRASTASAATSHLAPTPRSSMTATTPGGAGAATLSGGKHALVEPGDAQGAVERLHFLRAGLAVAGHMLRQPLAVQLRLDGLPSVSVRWHGNGQ